MTLKSGLAALCGLSVLSIGAAAFADCGQVVVVRVKVNVTVVANQWNPPMPAVPGGVVIQQQQQQQGQQQQQQQAAAYAPDIPAFMSIPPDGSGLAGRKLRTFKEPDQYAVIAWDGKEEILTLMTKQASLQGTGAVLNILPLPGKPISIKPGDEQLFAKAKTAVAKKLDLASRPVELEAKIGAHNIFVISADSTEQFLTELNTYVSKKFDEKAKALVTDQLRDVIGNYVKRGFKYFAFDLMQQGTDEEVKKAIEYRFESPYVYYPMYVSRAGGKGKTTLQAVVFTREILKQTATEGLPVSQVQGTQSVQFSEDELAGLGDGGQEISRLLGPGGGLGRLWTVSGELDGFAGDIMMRP